MDDLHGINWISVPNTPYIMKYVFHDTGYHIMLTDLTFVYSERLDETNILQRFSVLNPFAQMKLQVILENLKKSLEKCLSQESELSVKLTSTKLIVSLEFSASLVSCKYNFEMDLMDAKKITEYIIAPTVFNALLSHRKILQLQKKVTAFESIKSSANISIPTQDPIDPDFLKGKNVPTDDLIDSFLKIQSYFKDLHVENVDAYNASRKEKAKSDHSAQSLSANKKLKLQENMDGESNNSIKFEDSEEKISIKKEETTSSDNPSQAKSNVKKKKLFKI